MMWRKHPLVRAGMGLALLLVTTLTIGLALLLAGGFWQDGQLAPRHLTGHVQSLSVRTSPGPVPAHFRFVSSAGETLEFDLPAQLLEPLQAADPTTSVSVEFSPHIHTLYNIEVNNQTFVQNEYRPGQFFQSWQYSAVVFLGLTGLVGLVGLIYLILSLLDWFSPARYLQGLLVARVERTELNTESFSILISPFNAPERPPRSRQWQFDLTRPDFLTTDGADFVAVRYTPFFRYVRDLRTLNESELPPGLRERASAGELRVRYNCGWRLWAFLYGDSVMGLALLGLAVLSLLASSVFQPDLRQMESGSYSLLLAIGLLLIMGAGYFLLRFRRKLVDIKSPRQVATGPVLSKWRVTGTSQDNRRLIVVADGGLNAGKEAVRRFDVSPTLYDQLQVGDIVEIEHTRHLRFICRLEVTGHQELTLAG